MMPGLILLFIALVAVNVLLAKVLVNWGECYFARNIESTLSDAEHIVNEGKLPQAWMQPFRERADAVRRKGGSKSKMERVGHKARQRCLRNLNNLIKFFQERNVTDTEETRDLLLTALKERRDWVAAAAWQDLLEPEQDAQDAAETTAKG